MGTIATVMVTATAIAIAHAFFILDPFPSFAQLPEELRLSSLGTLNTIEGQESLQGIRKSQERGAMRTNLRLPTWMTAPSSDAGSTL